MGKTFARGDKAWGECARSGRRLLLRDMVQDGRYPGMLVDPDWWEGEHPQEKPVKVDDPVALRRPAPEHVVLEAGVPGSMWDIESETIRAALLQPVLPFSVYQRTRYATDGETTASGYSAGGYALSPTIDQSSGRYWVNFGTLTTGSLTGDVRYVEIYSLSSGNRTLVIYDLGRVYSLSAETLQVTFPTPTSALAVVVSGGAM